MLVNPSDIVDECSMKAKVTEAVDRNQNKIYLETNTIPFVRKINQVMQVVTTPRRGFIYI